MKLRLGPIPWTAADHDDHSNENVNQTVNDGVAHSKNPKKCAYHVTFDLDLDLEHTLDARLPGDHASCASLVAIRLREEAICAKVYRQTTDAAPLH